MKCQIPQISWHSRDPVLSVDFQPIDGNVYRLASGGTDSHVLIWYVTYQENKTIAVECASDLYRHNKSVNVVRFSPNGELLASGDDEGALFLWQLKDRDPLEASKDEENANKEEWYPVKLLRGHLEDIYDISWSSDSKFLVSASMDNTSIVWDMQKYQKLHILSDCKGYVQGVAWDPLNQYIASVGSDRALRIHNINTKKTLYKVQSAPWTIPTEKGNIKARLFYDDTLKSYVRRLSFTPDGELLLVPSGIVDKGEECTNTTYVFSRHILNKPVFHLPTKDKYTVAVKCNPFLYKLRCDKENKCMIDLPYRMIFAVAACDSILLYDTEQMSPFAFVSNIHYTHLTDMSWSPDGLMLVASSTDGYCSFLLFTREELGEIYVQDVVDESTIKLDVLENTAVEQQKVTIQSEESITKSGEIPPNPKSASPHQDMGSNNSSPKGSDKASDKNINNSPKGNSDKALDKSVDSSLKGSSDKASAKSVNNSPKGNSDKASTKIVNSSPIGNSDKASVKIVTPKSSKKTPKMCSIKTFFTSPKVRHSTEALKTESLKKYDEPTKVVSGGKCSKNLNDEASIKEQTVNVMEKLKSDVVNVVGAMDVDCHDSSVEFIFESKPKSAEKSKCQVQLNFQDKIKGRKISKAGEDEPMLTSDDAVSSFEDLESKEPPVCENEWKLELSQDEGLTPMDVDPIKLPEKCEVKTENKVQTVPVPSTSNLAQKRRIPLVTLSKKISMCQKKN